ncbi:uncharacterized protein METZ01_LOCUS382197, partial [marine metagenome]
MNDQENIKSIQERVHRWTEETKDAVEEKSPEQQKKEQL